MNTLVMLAVIAAGVYGLYLLGRKTNDATGRIIEVALLVLLALAVFGAGGVR